MNVLVLGVGNILLGDEGLGVKAAEYIEERYDLPKGVDVADGGTGGPRLTSLLKGYGCVIILDAVVYRQPPGTLYRIPGEEISKRPPAVVSAHDLSVAEMLSMANLEGIEPEVVILGMEPETLKPSLHLSTTVKSKLPRLVELVLEELKRLGFEIKEMRAYA